jgi:creatinine amidohydrolase
VTPSSSAPAKLTSNEESSAIEAARSGVSLKGVYLETLSWAEAEPLLRSDPLIVIPVGAATKEHGPHLPLNTDRLLADHFARRLAERVAVVLLPTVTYGYFPHFSPFPGSTHLEAHTFEATMREIILSMHRHGPRRFLVLNTGVSTFPVLEVVARDLDRVHRLLVGVTNIGQLGGPRASEVLEQTRGSHADEAETSMLMVIAPDSVRRDRLVAEMPDRPASRGVFVPPTYHREPGPGHSATGVYGDATLASETKGKIILDAIVEDLVAAAERLSTFPIAPTRPAIPWPA